MTAPARFLVHPSPVGDILIVTDAGRLVSLHPVTDVDAEVAALGAWLGHPLVPADDDPLAARAADQLDEYFDGERMQFDLPLDLDRVRGFTRAALEAVRDIPYGETAAYGEVAVMAGTPGAARAVGTACRTTPFSVVIPVHRVVRADGSIGEYGGRSDIKRFLVDLERRVLAARGTDADGERRAED